MDAKIETTGIASNEQSRHEQHARTADFIERVRVNQQKLTAELNAHYDFIVCGSGSSGSRSRSDARRHYTSKLCRWSRGLHSAARAREYHPGGS